MLVNEFWKIPFLRFILPFISGILFASADIIGASVSFIIAALFAGVSFVYRPFLNHELSYHKRWIFGLLISIALFFGGAAIASYQFMYSGNMPEATKVIGIVSELVKETAKSVKLELKVVEYQKNDVWQPEQSKILVYLEKDSLSKSLLYGDLILLSGEIREIKNSGNPDEFDYKSYLARKKIHFQTFEKSGQWIKLASNQGSYVYALAYKLRKKALSVYQSTGISGDEFAILAALTLGVKDYLSDEIVEAYSDSGAMHVLAVSGLHVGIIMLVLNQLLFFMRKNKFLRVLQSILIILSLWTFAFITGLSPSVTRASLMMSFIILGKISRKKPSTYNSIAASAFIILLINPMALFNVGFQLSYLAVIAIIFFQPRIYRLLDIKNKWMDWVWKLTTVSIAAQIGTSAISIYYFHQFPLYALLTNLIAIPAAFVIMYGAIVLLISGYYLPLAKGVAAVLSFIIKMFNQSTSFIESIPGASIEFISLGRTELFLVYFSLTLFIIYLFLKKKQLVFVICILGIMVFALRDFRYLAARNNKSLIVFNSANKSVFATVSNGRMNLYADAKLYKDKKAINYLSANFRTKSFIQEMNVIDLDSVNPSVNKDFPVNFVQIDSLKVAFIFGKISNYVSDYKLHVDYLVLANKASLNIDVLQSLFHFKKLIIDSSVARWKQDVLTKDCETANISFYNISEEGAFVHNIK
ncbi:MAG: ComEC/Rec2 family competence protein [Bacteroidales bacterium]|nr:ComEC/Rec2 family competence protein [Bacteroidales bacterium]